MTNGGESLRKTGQYRLDAIPAVGAVHGVRATTSSSVRLATSTQTHTVPPACRQQEVGRPGCGQYTPASDNASYMATMFAGGTSAWMLWMVLKT